MSLSGRDYHQAFDEACEELPNLSNQDEVKLRLLYLERIIWEAIRGVFFLSSLASGFLIAWLISSLLPEDTNSFIKGTIFLIFVVLLTLPGYWLLRLMFWHQISRHIKGRRFGK